MSMTDASPMNDPQVLSMLDNLRNLSAQIKEIDAELGTDTSGPVAQRNKIANELIAQYNTPNVVDGQDQNPFTKFVGQVINNLQNNPAFQSDEMRVAVYTELGNQMKKNFGDAVTKFLTSKVESLPKSDTPEVTDTRKEELATLRAKKVGIFKAQKDMLKFYEVTELPSDIDEPPVRRGAIGPRGAQFTKSYQFYVDGKIQQLTDNDGVKTDASLSNIATTKLKKPLGWSTKQLRDFIINELGASVNAKTNEVDLPDVWEVTLPTPINAVLKGVVTTTPSVDESDDGEDDNGSEPTEDAFASA